MRENEMITTTKASEKTVQTVIKFGKINCIVRETFSDNGKEIDELLEKLVVEKCKASA